MKVSLRASHDQVQHGRFAEIGDKLEIDPLANTITMFVINDETGDYEVASVMKIRGFEGLGARKLTILPDY